MRFNLRKGKTSLLPLDIGFYDGFDYGRVWSYYAASKKWNTYIGGGTFASLSEMIIFNLFVF